VSQVRENNSTVAGSDASMTASTTDMNRPAGPWLARTALRLMDGLTGACLGALFYGSWGVFANAAHGMDIALRSGSAQGTMSFVVTLTGTTLMHRLYAGAGARGWRATRAILGALGIIYGLIIGVHWWLGTPEILLTLAPGLPITIGFCLIFTISLVRLDSAGAKPRRAESAKAGLE